MLITNTNQRIAVLKLHVAFYLAISISVYFFILFFQPFSLDRFEFENKLIYVGGYGLIMLLGLVFSHFAFSKLFTQRTVESYQNSVYGWLYNLVLLTITSLGFIFYSRYVGQK